MHQQTTTSSSLNAALPAIPEKRYFAIGEVSDLCQVKPHVLRYWEQEFPQLKPVKRRGNRRYYKYHDVEIVRQIRSLLYEEGFTIGGARKQLKDHARDQSKSSGEIQSSAQKLTEIRQEIEALIHDFTL